MSDIKNSNFKVWTEQEEKDLLSFFESHWTLGQISSNLGRSIGVVRSRLREMGWVCKSDIDYNKIGQITKEDFWNFEMLNIGTLTIPASAITAGTITASNFICNTEDNLTNLNNNEESEMSRRIVDVQLWDLDKGLNVDHSLVGVFEGIVTEDDDNTVIQQVLMENDVKDELDNHNVVRQHQIDLDILKRTGSEVKLKPVKLKDLSWKVVSS